MKHQHANHTLHAAQSQVVWDHSIPPALSVSAGDIVEFEVRDASGGQLSPDSAAADVPGLDISRANPVTGPVYIEGAEPGDAVRVRLLEFRPSGWGWTAIIPGFGLLADDFPQPALHQWKYDQSGKVPAAFSSQARIPIKPFAGTIGLAPAEKGAHSTIPPRRVGGNMDTRDIATGAELILPVEVTGALFSVGDTHAAQGDGEVCGTAIESPMNVALAFDLIKAGAPAFPQFQIDHAPTRHIDGKGYWVSTGIGPDLMDAARNAVRATIDRLCAEQKMTADDAYMLCSVAGDLRITEIVDAPNWTVAFYFPRAVFE